MAPQFVRIAICLMALPLMPNHWLVADEFRIASKVFVGNDKTPKTETLTLFRAGIVYDFLSTPEQVAVFDKPHGRFILLNPTRKVKTELPTRDVEKMVSRMQQIAAESKNPKLRLYGTVEFDSEFHDDNDRLTVRSGNELMYRVDTIKAPSREAAQQYREYSDSYVRLNALLNPHSTPPYARISVNRELVGRQLVAKHVELTIGNDTRSSDHEITWKLLPTDNKRIEETDNQLTRFRAVELEEFLNPESRTAGAISANSR